MNVVLFVLLNKPHCRHGIVHRIALSVFSRSGFGWCAKVRVLSTKEGIQILK